MRSSLVFFSIIIVALSSELKAQWLIKYLDESSYSYETVIKFRDDSVGLMMGNNSVVLKSVDVGETWNTVNLDTRVNIKDFQFIGDSVIYAIGDHYIGAGSNLKSKLIRSTDSGDTWDSITSFPGLQLKALWFIDKDTGMLAGFDAILRTTDGGKSWDTVWKVTDHYQYGEVVEFDICTTGIGYAIGVGRTLDVQDRNFENFILRTTDTGISWEKINTLDQSLRIVHFLNQDTGFVGTESRSIFRTEDGGVTWSGSKIVDYLPVSSMHFISDKVGYASGGTEIWLTKGGGGEFHISKTVDGGVLGYL